MTDQLIFEEWLPAPAARKNDPATSKAAAGRLKPNTQMARIAIAYREHGPLIDDEAGNFAGLAHAGYWKRCSDLRKAGIIEPTGETRTGKSGEQQRVCRLTVLGIELVNSL